jgi:hypothetical protein
MNWVWQKDKPFGTNLASVKNQPLRIAENIISVWKFSKIYKPQNVTIHKCLRVNHTCKIKSNR